MKRYLVFYGDCYYPSGGINDFIGDFDNIQDCEKAIELKHKENRSDDDKWEWAWKQIYDTKTKTDLVNTIKD
jgi:hypothetical protein